MKKIKKRHLYGGIGIVIVLLFTGYFALGYLNSYIGYYGYNKHKYRRYSQTRQESVDRDVFIKDLLYKLESADTNIIINNVFIERGYRWGSSNRKTKKLTKDTLNLNSYVYMDKLYQISVAYSDKKGRNVWIRPKKEFYSDINYFPIKETYIKDSTV
ncbi:MAG: hypothetical protein ACK5MD_06900 [Flavobacteriales bacterium]